MNPQESERDSHGFTDEDYSRMFERMRKESGVKSVRKPYPMASDVALALSYILSLFGTVFLLVGLIALFPTAYRHGTPFLLLDIGALGLVLGRILESFWKG